MKTENKIKILSLVPGAKMGGTERMVVKLYETLKDECEVKLIVLGNKGGFSEKFEECFDSVVYLMPRDGFTNALKKFISLIKNNDSDIIVSWLYHANLLSIFFTLFANKKIIWNVRSSLDNIDKYKRSTRWVIKLNSLLSSIPSRIIYNSHESLQQHINAGFNGSSSIHIPNGFEIDKFNFSDELQQKARITFDIDDKSFVIGFLGRCEEEKNPFLFLEAAERLLQKRRDVKFLMAGRGNHYQNDILTHKIEELGIDSYIKLLGPITEVNLFFNALDVFWLTSHREAFPNVIGEAMLCGVPCVATDVGDVKTILGSYGRVVKSHSAEQFADETIRVIKDSYITRNREKMRDSITERFSIKQVAEKFLSEYQSAS